MKYPSFRAAFIASNGEAPRSGIQHMTYWRQFVADAQATYKKLWTTGQLDAADLFIEVLLKDDTIPMARREALWHFAEGVSEQPVVWADAPLPAPEPVQQAPRWGVFRR